MMQKGVLTLIGKYNIRNSSRFATQRTFMRCSAAQNKISTDSWASQRLAERGETLTAVESPLILCTEELLKNTPAKITKLSEEILTLNVVEVHELLTTMQNRLGYQPEVLYGSGGSTAAPAAEAQAEAAPKAAEKDSFDLKLGAVDAKAKIKIIKEVRVITGLGLKEAKELVEKAPTIIKQGLKKEEAESLLKLLAGAGAEAELV